MWKYAIPGVMLMLSVLSVILICIGSAILLFHGVRMAVIFFKAKRSGITRTVRSADLRRTIIEIIMVLICVLTAVINGVTAHSHRAYIRDMDERGLAAIADKRGVSVDELSVSEEVKPAYLDAIITSPTDYRKLCELEKERFIAKEQRMYSQSAVHHTDLMVMYLVFSVFFVLTPFTHRAIFTKDGIYVLDKPDFSPFKTLARVNGKYLCFYEETVPEIHLISIKATDENLETFKKFIVPENFRVCR